LAITERIDPMKTIIRIADIPFDGRELTDEQLRLAAGLGDGTGPNGFSDGTFSPVV
jgi:hypothetical protein